MMRVTVEIVPFGQEEDKYTIHTIEIGNMGRCKKQPKNDNRTWCNYNIWLDGELAHENLGHPREEGALKLVGSALTMVEINKWLSGERSLPEPDTKEKDNGEIPPRQSSGSQKARPRRLRKEG